MVRQKSRKNIRSLACRKLSEEIKIMRSIAKALSLYG